MENRENQNPGREDDLSKAQNQQQPDAQQGQQSEIGQAGQSGQAFGQPLQQPSGQSQQQQPSGQSQQSEYSQSQQQPTGQADYGSAGQSESLTQQRSDAEGGSATGQASGSDASFMGKQRSSDSESGLIEDKDSSEFSRDGQGAPE